MKNKNFGGGCFYGRQDYTPYEIGKIRAEEKAILWQFDFSHNGICYSELNYWREYFYKLAKRYGLIKEFRENGII